MTDMRLMRSNHQLPWLLLSPSSDCFSASAIASEYILGIPNFMLSLRELDASGQLNREGSVMRAGGDLASWIALAIENGIGT